MKLSFWADVAAEVLNEPAVDSARAVLAQALLLEFSASQVARVHVAGGSVEWFLSGAGTMLPVNSLPVAAEVQRHPLNRYRLETAGLTPRELVVLGLLARGRTAGAIAARLGISARTVHKHQEHLYRKLGAVDRLSAVLRAQEAGVLASAPRP